MENDENPDDKKDFKQNLTGCIYQLKLLLLILWRGFQNDRYEFFELGIEIKDAEKFDDIIFHYVKNQKRCGRYLQAKHRSENRALKYKDFVSNYEKDIFNLPKYFISYRKMKQRLSQIEINDLILCTNLPFNSLILRKNENSLIFNEVSNDDDDKDDIFYDAKSKKAWKKYHLKSTKTCPELEKKLKELTNLNLLAKEMANCIFRRRKMDLQNYWISSYFNVLLKEGVTEEQENFRLLKENQGFTKLKNDEIREFNTHFTEALKTIHTINSDHIKFEKNFIEVLKNMSGPTSANSKETAQTLADHILDKNLPIPIRTFENLNSYVKYQNEYAFTSNFLENKNLSTNASNFRFILFERYKTCVCKSLETHRFSVTNAVEILDGFKNIKIDDQTDDGAKDVATTFVNYILYKQPLGTYIDSMHSFLNNVFERAGMGELKFTAHFVTHPSHQYFREMFLTIFVEAQLKNTVIKFKQDLTKMNLLVNAIKHAFTKAKNENQKTIKFDQKNYKEYENLNGLISALNGSIFEATDQRNQIKFMADCFDCNKKFSNNLAQNFITNLKKVFQSMEPNDLKCYTIEIENYPPFFHTLKEEGDIITDIENFFKILYFVTSPKEEELINEVSHEIGEEFSLLETDLMTNDLFQDILTWAKEEGEQFLNRNKIKTFMENTKSKLSSKLQLGCTVQYCNKLEEYELTFNNTLETVTSFLATKIKKILIVKTNELTLSSVKVAQSVKSFYEKLDSFIFCPLTSLLRMEYAKKKGILEKFISNAFKSTADVIIIVDKRADSNVAEFCETLCDIIKKSEKQIIVISDDKESLLTKIFESFNCENFFVNEYFDKTDFKDLTIASQNAVMENFVINFQGKNTFLKNVIDKNDASNMLNSQILEEFICDKEIKVGQPLPGFKKSEFDCFVPRKIRLIQMENMCKIVEKLNGHIFAFEAPETEILLACSCYVKHCNLINGNDIIEEKEQFQQICENHPECYIHWLKFDCGKFFWFRSYVPSGKMLFPVFYDFVEKSNISTESYYVNESYFFDYVKENQIVIIADKAGMGKTTLLSNFAKIFNDNTCTRIWKIRINLTQYVETLSQIQYTIKNLHPKDVYLKFDKFGSNDFGKVVLESLLNDKEPDISNLNFENQVFYYFFTKGHMLFLFDGFDEINPDFSNEVMTLIKILTKNKNNKVWITTRPNFKNYLEQEFNTCAYELKPFDKKDQKTYLIQFWLNEWKKKKGYEMPNQVRVEIYARTLIDEACKKIGDIIGIPLQIKMLAEIFQENIGDVQEDTWHSCFKYVEMLQAPHKPNLKGKLDNIFTLYKDFFKRKVEKHFFHEKGVLSNTPYERKLKNESFQYENNVHKILGFLALLGGADKTTSLLADSELELKNKWMAEFKEGAENIGIIDSFNDGGYPLFGHLTYAEYFAACFLADKIHLSSQKAFEAFKEAEKILENDVSLFVECFRYLLKSKIYNLKLKKELEGESILYFAVKCGLVNCVNIFITSKDFNDDLLNFDSSNKTLLTYAVKYKQPKVVLFLICFIFDLIECCSPHSGYNSLYYLSQFVNETLNNIILPTNLSLAAFLNDIKNVYSKSVKSNLEQIPLKEIIEKSLLSKYSSQERMESNAYKLLFSKNLASVQKLLNVVSFESIFFMINSIEHINVQVWIDFFMNGIYYRLDLTNSEKLAIFKEIFKNINNENEQMLHKNMILSRMKTEGNVHSFLLEYLLKSEPKNIEDTKMIHDFFKDACHQNQKELLKVICENYLNDISDPLCSAIKHGGSLKTIMIVNKSKKNFYFVESGAEDALFVATKCRCNKKILEYLMENGFNDANKPYENGKTAFMLAVENDNDEIIKLFLEKCEYIGSENATKTMKEYYNNFGAFDINLITNGKPRLHHAISENDVLLLKFLIQKGADIFLKDSMEKLPLSSARKNNLHEIVEILMSHNADNLTFIDREKNSPLHLAARQENFDAVKSLLKSGAYYNIENIKGETPKSMAKKNEEVENLFKGIDRLFDDAKNPNKKIFEINNGENNYFSGNEIASLKDKNGWTLLHHAVKSKNVSSVKTLLIYSNIYNKDKEGRAPLSYAVENDDMEMTKFLLNEGTFLKSMSYKCLQKNKCTEFLTQIENCFESLYADDMKQLISKLNYFERIDDLNLAINVRDAYLEAENILEYSKRDDELAIYILLRSIDEIVYEQNKWETIMQNRKIKELSLMMNEIEEYLASNINQESIIDYYNNCFVQKVNNLFPDEHGLADKIISNCRFFMKRNSYATTLLHAAYNNNNEEIIKWLIDEKNANHMIEDASHKNLLAVSVTKNANF